MEEYKYGMATRSIHTSKAKHKHPHPVNTPIYLSSTFAFPTVEDGEKIFSGENPNGYAYGRLQNPTVVDVEKTMASLEGAEASALFASGMAAISTVFSAFLKSGDHIIADKTLYGGTHSTLTHKLPDMQVEVTMIDATDIELIKKSIKPNTKMIYFETPTNPTMRVVAIKPIVDLAREHDILTVIDATFMSPILMRPIEQGVDMVIHSVTKYLNGHSDVIAGLVSANQELMNAIMFQRVHSGGLVSPFEAYLIGRGLKTLKIRVMEHEKNGKIVADYLKSHPMVKSINFIGHDDNPGHEIAKSQQDGFGSMMAFEIKGDLEIAKKFVNQLKIITRAVSLGGVESLISHPASTTHSDLVVSHEDRIQAGITDTLMRLSVGIEDVEDLIHDLEHAFNAVREEEIV